MTILAVLTLLFMVVLITIPDVWFLRYVLSIPVWLLLAYAIASVRTVTLTLDRTTNQFSVLRQGWFGQREHETGTLSSIQNALVESNVQKDTDGSVESVSFRLCLELEGRRRIPMQTHFEFERRSKDAILGHIQVFLGLESTQTHNELRSLERCSGCQNDKEPVQAHAQTTMPKP